MATSTTPFGNILVNFVTKICKILREIKWPRKLPVGFTEFFFILAQCVIYHRRIVKSLRSIAKPPHQLSAPLYILMSFFLLVIFEENYMCNFRQNSQKKLKLSQEGARARVFCAVLSRRGEFQMTTSWVNSNNDEVKHFASNGVGHYTEGS